MRHRKPAPAPRSRPAKAARTPGIDPREVLSGLQWRSSEPVEFPDRDLGPARLVARGVYSIRIADPDAFRRAFRGNGTKETLQGRLEARIVSRFDRLLKSRLETIRDLPGLYNELATEMRLEVKEDFSRWGIHLIDFFVTAVVPTPDFQEVLNARDERGATGTGAQADSSFPTPSCATERLVRDADPPAGPSPVPGAAPPSPKARAIVPDADPRAPDPIVQLVMKQYLARKRFSAPDRCDIVMISK
jgi:hypothetical protein